MPAPTKRMHSSTGQRAWPTSRLTLTYRMSVAPLASRATARSISVRASSRPSGSGPVAQSNPPRANFAVAA
jgi:hypothetical protein